MEVSGYTKMKFLAIRRWALKSPNLQPQNAFEGGGFHFLQLIKSKNLMCKLPDSEDIPHKSAPFYLHICFLLQETGPTIRRLTEISASIPTIIYRYTNWFFLEENMTIANGNQPSDPEYQEFLITFLCIFSGLP